MKPNGARVKARPPVCAGRALRRRSVENLQAWAVLRNYCTSFHLVTRLLPTAKRQKVEAIYAAVRYPDEVVDSFPLSAEQQQVRLAQWADQYDRALNCTSIREALKLGTSSFLVGFTKVAREAGIPAEHYHAFLGAMRRDIAPAAFPEPR